MALLNFKYGQHGNLPEWSLSSVGTVFVTTDEQAMHIDLPDGRVVISQIINVASVTEWQSMKPPYSTQAFYYIVDANALLKYTGDGTTHSWKQINSTADVQSAIDDLTEIVGTKDDDGNWTEGSLGAIVESHTTDITDMKPKIEALTGSVQTVATHVTNVEALVHTLEAVVGYAGSFETADDALASAEAGEICLVDGVIKLCSADDAGEKYLTDYQTIVQEIEDLKDEVATVKESVTSNETIVDLQSRVKALEDWKVALVAEIGEPADGDTAATGMYALIAAAQKAADDAQDTADTALTGANKANDAIGNDGTDGKAKTGLYAAIDTNATNITDNASKIAANTTAIEANAEAIETNADDIDKLEGRATTAEQNIGTLQTTVGDASSGLVKTVNDNTTAIGTNATNIADEIARAKKAEEANAQAITDLRTEVMEDIQTADAMVFKGVVATEAELLTKEATAEVGHTYKASAEFVLDPTGEAISVHIGDLLIATGDEDEETGIIQDVVWKHVPSGYVADYNPKIEAAEDVAGDNIVVLALSSGVKKDEAELSQRGDLGKIALATEEGSALTVSTDGTGKVTFSMVWESFDPPVTTE